ncbi:MAG: IS110 family transposase [Prevotellaceae bacterium]|jgi:transposase|nr:IS110 family transposase [Prevotellaceae bacterium]
MGKVSKKSKKQKATNRKKKITQFEILRPNVAGIDVSDNGGMMVAYPISETEIVVEEFDCYTGDLRSLSKRLKEHKIESVAMESTGVYWIPLFLLLQEEGFEVYLVNSKHVKNVTGRKDDEEDAEWLQKLHRCGLLSASFQPDEQTRTLRSTVRHRHSLIETRSTYLNRMQKALEQMNIKLHTVISDIDGKSGQAIITAIINGERDPEKLANLCDPRIKASREEIVKSLDCFWRKEHLFELEQCYKLYKYHNEMIAECDNEMEQLLQEAVKKKHNGVMPELGKLKTQLPQPKMRKKNAVSDNVSVYLEELNGVDITEVSGLSAMSILTIYSEIGTDMSCWKNAKHFTSWAGLAPNTKISSGKIISCHVPKKKQYVGQVFRMAAMSLRNNKGPLGDFYRRICAKHGAAVAIVASARKLAVIYYNMMTSKLKYNPQDLINFQNKYKEIKIKKLEKYLEKLKSTA